MNYNISDRMNGLHPSAIREMFKLTLNNPSVVPFSAGNPSPDVFPVREIANITQLILNDSPVTALQYSLSEGYAPLRSAVGKMLDVRESGLVSGQDEVLIVTGAQQGIEISAKCLLNQGDTIICENPSFIGALNAFRSYGLNLVGVPMEADGMDIGELEKAIEQNKNAKVIYTIPNFQNPAGCTMSAQKRRELYELACKHNLIVLEDNPYGELIYGGEKIPSIKSMDKDGRVIYVGSFSKIISPGLRVGYIVCNQELASTFTVAKQCGDVHTPILNQMICERFLNTVNLGNHIGMMCKSYKAKRDLMVDCLNDQMKGRITFVKPEGGLFVWCTLPKGSDMMGFCTKAAEKGVAVVPGATFMVSPRDECTSFRITFSTPTAEQVTRGIGILATV